MTVLEETDRHHHHHHRTSAASGSSSSMSSGLTLGDRYITPEYLAPLPTSPESKNEKSPLQLLAQTCSQIGADSLSNKILSSTEKLKSTSSSSSSTSSSSSSRHSGDGGKDDHPSHKAKLHSNKDNNNGSVSPNINVSDLGSSNSKPVSFKPYAAAAGGPDAERNAPHHHPHHSPRNNSTSASPSSLSAAASPKLGSSGSPKSFGGGGPPHRASSHTPTSSHSGTSPVIQSGLEVLTGGHHNHHHLGGHHQSSLGKLGSVLDPGNPAFRPHGSLSTLSGYPPPLPQGPPSSAPPHPGVCRDPFCRDPACPTATYNAYLARISAVSSAGLLVGGGGGSAAGGGLPPGYLELLEAYKLYAPGTASALPLPPPPPTSVAGGSGGSPGGAAGGGGGSGPYICNWMNGRDYCGKRFTNAEELLVHLKTHTNLSVSSASAAAAAEASSHHLAAVSSAASLNAAYSSLFGGGGSSAAAAAAAAAAASLRGPYPSALSLAASRYSPYGKPGYPSPVPPSLGGGLGGLGAAAGPGGLPPGLPPSLVGGIPPYLSSLGAAAAANPLSLYSLYGGRL